MKNYYSTVDDIILTFSDIEENVQGFDEISVYFERPNENGFDFAEGKLPNNMFYKTYGFSEDELMDLQNYLKNNSSLIVGNCQRERRCCYCLKRYLTSWDIKVKYNHMIGYNKNEIGGI